MSLNTNKTGLMLIPGSMIAVPFFTKSDQWIIKQQINGSFEIFDQEVRSGEVDIFCWHSQYNKSYNFNPFGGLRAYLKDCQRVLDKNLQKQLYQAISANQPKVILAHSKGCQLILDTFLNYGLPESVKTVILLQSDSDITDNLKLLVQKFQVYNIYAKDDLTLWFSCLLNLGKLRAGLVSYNHPKIKNISYKSYGIHTRSLQDIEFKDWVLGTLLPASNCYNC